MLKNFLSRNYMNNNLILLQLFQPRDITFSLAMSYSAIFFDNIAIVLIK